MAYNWPGNIRELRNVLERTLILGELPLPEVGPAAEPGGEEHGPGAITLHFGPETTLPT